MRFKKFDLNLLVALDVLIAERNVTRAAERLRLTQSAASHALSALREYLNDPLLLRDGNRMQLTPRAEALVKPVREILSLISSSLENYSDVFEPETAETHFVVSMTEYTQAILLPPLLNHLAKVAPKISITIQNQPPEGELNLTTGEVHLVVTQSIAVSSPIYSKQLFEDEFVCAVPKSNTKVGNRLSFEDFSQLKHAVYSGARIFANQPIDVILTQYGVSRHIGVTLESFRSLEHVLSSTDLITIIPKLYCPLLVKVADVRFVDLPIAIPKLLPTMYWHRMKEEDPAHIWFRNLLSRIAEDFGRGHKSSAKF